MQLAVAPPSAAAAAFDDFPVAKARPLPQWLSTAPADLQASLARVRKTGKQGLLLYFGQADCAYCQAHLERNWGDRALARLTRRHFETLALDIHGSETVRDLGGRALPESALARQFEVVLSPTLLFLDGEGEPILRLEGYQGPARFRAALEYVAGGAHRRQGFREFLRRARGFEAAAFEAGDSGAEFFAAPEPLLLDRSQFPADKPLLVIFEEPECADCEALHAGPLADRKIARMVERLETVAIDMESAMPVLTPDGEVLPARRWAAHLGLSYAPTLVFFDRAGAELLRIESPVGHYRLNNLLEYVLSGAYRETDFQLWCFQNAR